MRIAVDCEFNGFGGELISMALVAEDGREWYGVLPMPDIIDPWVNENVFPVLLFPPMSRSAFRNGFRYFLQQFDNPMVVADWYTDLVHFFQIFAGRDHSESFHIPLKAELLPDMEFLPSKVPHNALEDARAIMATLLSKAPSDAKSTRSKALDELGELDGELLASEAPSVEMEGSA